MNTKRTIGSVAVAALLAGACSAARIAGPIPALPYAAASPACGPADGPAVMIVFSQRSTTDVYTASPPLARVVIWHPMSELSPKRWVLGGQDGFASYYSGSGEGESATRGEVTVDRIDASNRIHGSVALAFPRAGTLAGRFEADWIPRQLLCG